MADMEIRNAADKLRETIELSLGRLADEIAGRPEIGTAEWQAEIATRDTAEGRARLKQWHLIKLQIAREAGVDQTGDAMNGYLYGATWAEIGEACGITKQAAHDRWAKYAEEYARG